MKELLVHFGIFFYGLTLNMHHVYTENPHSTDSMTPELLLEVLTHSRHAIRVSGVLLKA